MLLFFTFQPTTNHEQHDPWQAAGRCEQKILHPFFTSVLYSFFLFPFFSSFTFHLSHGARDGEFVSFRHESLIASKAVQIVPLTSGIRHRERDTQLHPGINPPPKKKESKNKTNPVSLAMAGLALASNRKRTDMKGQVRSWKGCCCTKYGLLHSFKCSFWTYFLVGPDSAVCSFVFFRDFLCCPRPRIHYLASLWGFRFSFSDPRPVLPPGVAFHLNMASFLYTYIQFSAPLTAAYRA